MTATARPRLLLHIGTHKTATSTLQLLMSSQRKALAAQGFCYPRTDREPSPNRNKHAFFRPLVEKGGPSFEKMHGALVEEFAASGCHTLVLSAEGLAQFPEHRKLDPLSIFARDFDIEVICYLRRQDYFAESLWNQVCKIGKETLPISDYVLLPRAVRYMTYMDILDRWGAFGKVTALGFETAREVGIVESFAAVTGMALPDPEKIRNISPSMTLAAALAVLNRTKDKERNWQVLEPLMGENLSRHALGSRLRAEILARFADHNARLAETYGVVFPDTLPDEGPDPLPDPQPEVIAHLKSEYDRRAAAIADEAAAQRATRKAQRVVPVAAAAAEGDVALASRAERRMARRAEKRANGPANGTRGKKARITPL
ncbi:MAG: hypothetical protein H7245_20645 [Candidatus Saccharibacteria bacterium]|nr:hypothetical protein [Pseudorhodobacter sp.]